MKKILVIAVSLLLAAALLVSCTPAGTQSEPSEAQSKAEESKPASTEKPDNKEEKSNTMTVYNVKDYGAKANGFDDADCIQAAIDDCAKKGGGVVYLPEGTYSIATTIVKKAKVSLKGDGAWSTYLQWVGGADHAMIDTSNEALHGTGIEGIFFRKNGNVKNVVGILGGATLENYNSAIGTFKDLVFFGLYCGISGNAEPSGVGIFDCYFENVFMSDCTYGFHLYGSGNTIVHPRVAGCEAGLVLDYLNGESFDGVHVIGGIFAANTLDILVPSKNGTRPCNFVGTWFETAEHGIISIPNPDTRIMNMTFRDCMLNSSADGKDYFLFDARNALGVVTLDSCTVVTDKGIVEPKNSESVLAIKNLQVYDDTTYIISDVDSGKFTATGDGSKTVFTFSHKVRTAPGTVSLTPASAACANGGYYAVADDKTVTITFTKAPAKGDEIAFYWRVEK